MIQTRPLETSMRRIRRTPLRCSQQLAQLGSTRTPHRELPAKILFILRSKEEAFFVFLDFLNDKKFMYLDKCLRDADDGVSD